MYSYQAYERGQDVNLQAAPSQAELLHREYKSKKEQLQTKKQKELFDKYGGEEHLQLPEEAASLIQTENYVEYSRSGDIIKGKNQGTARSKWDEDVYINNHTQVWGSWWHGNFF